MLNRHFLYFCLCSYVHKLIAHIILDSAHIRPKIHFSIASSSFFLKILSPRWALPSLPIVALVVLYLYEWYVENGDTRTLANLQVLQSKLNHPRQ